MSGSKMSIICCAAWVAQGKAITNPEKVEICEEDIARIMEETRNKMGRVDINAEDGNTADSDDSDWEDDSADAVADAVADAAADAADDKKMDTDTVTTNNIDDIDKSYGMDTYDQEQEDPMGKLTSLTNMTVFVNAQDDPLLAAAEEDPDARAAREEDEESETDNLNIKDTDNLIVLGHCEINETGSMEATLEVYVYNDDGIYPHHENLLPEMPLCMEWLDYMPGITEKGNLVAIGSAHNLIEVWDLDLIDGLEAAYTLGVAGSKKKKKWNKKSTPKNLPINSHTNSVLALAWNKEYDHILASGSADGTVILWDLQTQTVSNSIRLSKSGCVQCLAWHPEDAATLVAGTTDGGVHVINCHDASNRHYKMQGKVEKTIWVSGPATTQPNAPRIHYVLACNDKGAVCCINSESKLIMWTFDSHDNASVEGMQMSSSVPGLLVTGSENGKLRIWDTGDNLLKGPPTLVVTLNPNVGRIVALKAAIEQPFVFCIGGDQKNNLFEIWDIRESIQVRKTFCPRVGLPVDEDGPDTIKLKVKKEESDDCEEGEDKLAILMKNSLNEEYGNSKKVARIEEGRIAKPLKRN